MKIGILVEDINSMGGVPRSIANLANGLVKYFDYSIEIISCFKGIEKEIKYKLDEKVKISYLALDRDEKINKIYKQIKFCRIIKSKIRDEKYDLIISTNAWLNIYVGIFGKKTRAIGCEHGAYSQLSSGWRQITKKVYKNLNRIVLLTKTEKEIYSKFSNEVIVIKNIQSFKCKEYAALKGNRILSVGRIDENKNIKNMIEIFKEVNKVIPDSTLRIIGNGDLNEIEKIIKYIKKLGLQDKVEIKGFTSEIKEEYLNSDVFIMTSKSEGLPMVLIESISCGVPCVSYDIKTGPSEIIENGVNGFLIEAFNKDEMTKKIKYILENKEVKIRMGKNAYIKSKEYSEKNIIKEWQKIICEVINEK